MFFPSLDMNTTEKRSIGHIGDIDRSAKKRIKITSLKHLSIFIKSYHHDVDVLTSDMDAEELPFHVVDNEEFVGKYIHFLATEATYLGGNNKVCFLF